MPTSSWTPSMLETAQPSREILDAVPDVVLILDPSGRIRYANRQVTSTLGYRPDELVGTAHDRLLPERVRTVHEAHVKRYFDAPVTRPMGVGLTLTARRKDGTEVPVEVSLSPIGEGEGRCLVVTLRDVTERTRLERAKELLANRLANAISIVPDALALFDAGDRLVLCNAPFRQRFRELPEPIEGRTCGELVEAILDQMGVPDGEERRCLREKRLAMRDGTAGTARKIDAPDGHCFRFFERRTDDGGTLLVVSDLTEDERVATELREARVTAESANRAKSEFLSSMSHELRTPLNAIVGFAQLMRRDKRDPLSAKGMERIEQIIRAGEHLANLVDDILDLSRIEAGRVSVSVAATPVQRVLARARDAVEHLAEQRQIALTETPLPEADLTVLADDTRLTQVVTNFATNAVKYNRPGGRVELHAKRSDGARVRITVSDTGLGIAPEKQGLVFQPFQRAGQETGPIEGTGIGLAIAKRLAEMMSGSVGFESTPGEGSAFWVELPACAPAATPTPRPTEPLPESGLTSDGEIVVLYIEDNPANASLMRAVFATVDNTKLLVSPTAEEGVALAKEVRPDAILMDINLPGMNGIEAVRVLREGQETARIPVIALTAAASTHERSAGTGQGFSHYLVKPVQLEAVLRALASVLPARQRPVTPAPGTPGS